MTTETPETRPALLEVVGLGKQVSSGHAPLQILQDIAFTVHVGDALAIVGASGSGKSTLLGLLAGLDLPSTGTVRMDGQDIFSLDEDARARLRGEKVGFVFQSFQLLPALTALENVMLPLELSGADHVRERAGTLLSRVGLAGRMTHYPSQLSGGEQQRVALVRAFASAPELLLADEPTGNLDAATGASIIDLLFEMNAEQGTTLILVTHDEALASRCARRVRLAAGRMVDQD